MIKLSMDEAAQQLSHLREQLTQGNSAETAELTENGRPSLALLPWDLYTALLHWAQVPTDPRALLSATPEIRQRALAVAVTQAESLYNDPELLGFEAFDRDDLLDAASAKQRRSLDCSV